MSELEVTVITKDDRTLIDVCGEATIYTASELREKILQEWDKSPEVTLNLARVREIDTAGLQIFLAAQRHATLTRKKLTTAGVSQPVVDLLQTFGLQGQFSSLPEGEAK